MEKNNKKKILIAEDDEMLIEIYKKKLEESGYDLSVAKNGREVIEIAKKNKPDLILLDLVMPEVDGFETIRLIREDPDLKKIKVVITSNLGQEHEKKKALSLGADDFLIKSNYDLNELAEKIRNYL